MTLRQGGGWELHGNAADIPSARSQVHRGRPGGSSASRSPSSERHHPGGAGQVCLVSGPPLRIIKSLHLQLNHKMRDDEGIKAGGVSK